MQTELILRYASIVGDYMKKEGLYSSERLQQAEFKHLKEAERAFRTQDNFTISYEEFTHLLNSVAALKSGRLMGHEIAAHITAAHLGVLGYVLLACPNLGVALMRFERYARLVDRGAFMQIQIHDGMLKIFWPNTGELEYHALFAELGLAAIAQFSRNLVEDSINGVEVCFMHQPLGSLDEYERFYGCRPQFGCSQVSFTVPATVLALPLRQPDENLLGILERQAKLALEELPSQDQFLVKVHSAIMVLSQTGLPNLADVANQLNVSARTLQRKLADHGHSFQELLEKSQLRLAEQLFKDERLQLIDIAQLLGYSDQSAFTRAFKRWTGTTPNQRRAELLEQALET